MNEDRSDDEPPVSIDLSRRKDGRPSVRPGAMVAATQTGRDAAIRGRVRSSMAGAERAAAPYVTMARITLSRLARDRLARAGGLVLALVALVGVFADMLASDLPVACRWRGVVYVLPNIVRPPALAALDCEQMRRERHPGDWLIPPIVAYGPSAQFAGDLLVPPLARGHLFGTDARGRDVFARVVHGARTAMGVGLVASMVLVVVGVAVGALAGFAGGLIDTLATRAVESLTAIPTIVLVLVVGGLVPHPGQIAVLGTIALTRWTELARLVRAEVILALSADYVTAARALGASPGRVLWRHVLPNVIGPAIAGAAFALAWVVLVEATVDFLGVSSQSSQGGVSWGEVLGEARSNAGAWWLAVFPGAALLATLIASNLVGEAARNALDPRLR